MLCVCVSAGCRLLQDLEVSHVEVDACGDAQAAAEGAVLGLFHYDLLKTKKKTKVTTQLHGRYANHLLFLARSQDTIFGKLNHYYTTIRLFYGIVSVCFCQ